MNNADEQMSASEGRGNGLNAGPGPLLGRSARRWLLAILVIFALIDLVILLLCPMFGGNCLYGFLTLIVYPVILSGLLGVLLPRFAVRYAKGWRARALISALGAAVLLAGVTICHVAAIWLFNSFNYGGVLVRQRLLTIELVLSMAYYTVLTIIAYASISSRRG
jgi:hypothetical protein